MAALAWRAHQRSVKWRAAANGGIAYGANDNQRKSNGVAAASSKA